MEVSTIDGLQSVLPPHHRAPGLHAGFWLRVVAWIIDALILGPVTALAVALVAATVLPVDGWGSGYAWGVLLWAWPVSFALAWLYYAVCESSRWQATPGKLALGLRVTDEYGRRVSFARASGRWLGMLVSGALFDVGYLLAGWTARKQALHDLMAGCCVVRRDGLQMWRGADRDPVAPHDAGVAAPPPRGMPGWAVALLVVGVGVFGVLPLAAALSAVAIPAYRNYRVRTEVATAMDSTTRARALIGEYIVQRGALPADNGALGLPAPGAISSTYVRSVRVANGKLVVTFGNRANAWVSGGHLVISPVGNAQRLRWHCASPDIAPRYLPRTCRD